MGFTGGLLEILPLIFVGAVIILAIAAYVTK